MKPLKHLSDKVLLENTEILVRQEREILTAVLNHLREIERRRLFSGLGFSSLFDYAVKKLGYSNDQAYRRINAMRLIKEVPEVENKIHSGAITLASASLAQAFFRREQKTARLSLEQKREVLEKIAHKSSREAEKVILSLNPKPLGQDRILPLSEEFIEIRFPAPAGLREKLEQLKGLLAHSHPGISLADLVEKLADLGLKEWNPGKVSKRGKTSTLPNRNKERPLGSSKVDRSVVDRSIPRPLRRAIWQRDQGKCRNCGAQHALQLDHITPIARGGRSSLENLRLLCRTCNQRAAIQSLGLTKMEHYINYQPKTEPPVILRP